MNCPNCRGDNNSVLSGARKYAKEEMNRIYPKRQRLCRACGTIFATREVYVPDDIRVWSERKSYVKRAFIRMGVGDE